MIIGITGHRDKQADWFKIRDFIGCCDLEKDLTVVHGGAIGFDTQVSRTIKRMNEAYGHSIKEKIIRPDYKNTDNKKFPPLKRNELIVNQSDIIFACYDGRPTGDTFYTIEYAKQQGKDVYFV